MVYKVRVNSGFSESRSQIRLQSRWRHLGDMSLMWTKVNVARACVVLTWLNDVIR